MRIFSSCISLSNRNRSDKRKASLWFIALLLVLSYGIGKGNLFSQESPTESITEETAVNDNVENTSAEDEAIVIDENVDENAPVTNENALVEETSTPGETGPDGGEISLIESDEGLSPLERYARTTSVHPLRRADILFFISIPFTLLWSNFLIDRFKDVTVIAAYFEGVRGGLNLRNTNFVYDHDSFAQEDLDPFYIFKWLNAVIWPLVILTNDFIERASDPEEWEQAKEEMYDNRFHLNLIYHPFR